MATGTTGQASCAGDGGTAPLQRRGGAGDYTAAERTLPIIAIPIPTQSSRHYLVHDRFGLEIDIEKNAARLMEVSCKAKENGPRTLPGQARMQGRGSTQENKLFHSQPKSALILFSRPLK
jgi:hypothetical protein